MPSRADFRLVVSAPHGPAQSFVFDQDHVVVGRGEATTLSIEHPAVSRRQFAIRRTRESGAAGFVLEPAAATNPTWHGASVARGGMLRFGDRLQIGPVCIAFERGTDRAARRTRPSSLLALAVLACGGLLLWLALSKVPPPAVETTQASLFLGEPTPSCIGPAACLEEARTLVARADHLQARLLADPAAEYDLVRALGRARDCLRVGQLSAWTIPGLEERLATWNARAQADYGDAVFKLGRATTEGDVARQTEQLTFLCAFIAEAKHPQKQRFCDRLAQLRSGKR